MSLSRWAAGRKMFPSFTEAAQTADLHDLLPASITTQCPNIPFFNSSSTVGEGFEAFYFRDQSLYKAVHLTTQHSSVFVRPSAFFLLCINDDSGFNHVQKTNLSNNFQQNNIRHSRTLTADVFQWLHFTWELKDRLFRFLTRLLSSQQGQSLSLFFPVWIKSSRGVIRGLFFLPALWSERQTKPGGHGDRASGFTLEAAGENLISDTFREQLSVWEKWEKRSTVSAALTPKHERSSAKKIRRNLHVWNDSKSQNSTNLCDLICFDSWVCTCPLNAFVIYYFISIKPRSHKKLG